MRNRKGLGAAAALAAVLAFSAQAAAASGSATVPENAATRGVIVLQPKVESPPAAAPTTPSTPSATKADPAATRTEIVAPVRPVPVQAPPPVRPLVVAPVIKSCARPFASTDLTLRGEKGFPAALAARLRKGQRVAINLAQPYPEKSDPPAQLSPWFAKVKDSGGAVTVKHYCQATRGLGSWLSTMFKPDPARLYRPAANFNVVLHSDGLDQIVTQVEFVPRNAR